MSEADQDRAVTLQQRVEKLTPAQRDLLAKRLRQRRLGAPAATVGPTTLVAHLVLRAGARPPSNDELRQFLAAKLPPSMVPATFVPTVQLPLLPNGKVDRQALAARGVPAPNRARAARPVSAIEAQLMRIWDDLIDIEEIGRDDNFFELGGHSLLVPRLIDRLRQDFGVALPLGAVFQSPTIRGLAATIAANHPAREWRCLVPIREQGARPPMYFVHGLGGEIGYFYNLAEYLDREQPVYGLQAPPEPFDDLEAMAAHYLSEVRRHQPAGPYLLGGFCVGGCVAYEMARQLAEAGETVRMLAVIDAVMPAPPPLRTRLRRLASRPPRELMATVEAHTRRLAKRMSASRRATGVQAPTPDLHFYGVPQAFQSIAARHYRAQLHYNPRPYAGDMWLFRTRHDDFDPDLGWAPLVGGRLEIRYLSGSHANVLKPPNITAAGQQLAAALEETVTARR